MVQMGGWGRRSPFSRTPAISLAGIPSYGLVPNVISSHTVTPAERRTVGQEPVGVTLLSPHLEDSHTVLLQPEELTTHVLIL